MKALLHRNSPRDQLLLRPDLVDHRHPGVEPDVPHGPPVEEQLAVVVDVLPVAVLEVDRIVLGEHLQLPLRAARALDRPLGEDELPELPPRRVHGQVARYPLEGPVEDRLDATVAPAPGPPDDRVVPAPPSQVVHDVDGLRPLEHLDLDAEVDEALLQVLRLLYLAPDERVRLQGGVLALERELRGSLGVAGLDGLLGKPGGLGGGLGRLGRRLGHGDGHGVVAVPEQDARRLPPVGLPERLDVHTRGQVGVVVRQRQVLQVGGVHDEHPFDPRGERPAVRAQPLESLEPRLDRRVVDRAVPRRRERRHHRVDALVPRHHEVALLPAVPAVERPLDEEVVHLVLHQLVPAVVDRRPYALRRRGDLVRPEVAVAEMLAPEVLTEAVPVPHERARVVAVDDRAVEVAEGTAVPESVAAGLGLERRGSERRVPRNEPAALVPRHAHGHRDAGGVEARGPPRGVPPDGVGTPHDEAGHPRGPHERGHRRPLLAVPPDARLERHVQRALGYQAAEVTVGRPRHAPLAEGHGLDARVGQGVLDGVPVVVGPSPPEDLAVLRHQDRAADRPGVRPVGPPLPPGRVGHHDRLGHHLLVTDLLLAPLLLPVVVRGRRLRSLRPGGDPVHSLRLLHAARRR
mmetsp:Transcript_24042/g.56948  ORF Transcript_24042/g.56948 Transcript_24042/m.56948 type:complete len:631 (+) Transcript_24042:105-1997(+)